MRLLKFSAAVCLLVAALPCQAEDRRGLPPQDELFQKVLKLDAAVFGAYNACDLEKFETLFSDDVEFYHDQGGAMTGKKPLLDALKNNICGKVRRELIADSVRVYPMKGYGALQTGVHRFHEGGSIQPTGEAQFVHLWQEKDGAWRITRVMSFDHGAVRK